MPDRLRAERSHFVPRDTSQAVEFKTYSAGGRPTRGVSAPLIGKYGSPVDRMSCWDSGSLPNEDEEGQFNA